MFFFITLIHQNNLTSFTFFKLYKIQLNFLSQFNISQNDLYSHCNYNKKIETATEFKFLSNLQYTEKYIQ